MVDYQTKPGQRVPCCVSMRWAIYASYVRKGYLLNTYNPPMWCGWTLKVAGVGYYDVSPIHFCPFCGKCLDEPDSQ